MFLLPALNFRYAWDERVCSRREGGGVKMKTFRCRKLEPKYKNLKVKKYWQICHSKTGPPYHISPVLVVLINLRGILLLIVVETNYRVSPCTGVNKIKECTLLVAFIDLPILVFTKSVNSNFCAFWLTPVTQNIANLVNTKTTIPLRVGEQPYVDIYLDASRPGLYIHTTIITSPSRDSCILLVVFQTLFVLNTIRF